MMTTLTPTHTLPHATATHKLTLREQALDEENSRGIHKAFEDCKTFLYYLDSGKGYEACQPYCADEGATFECQCETLADIHSVQDYAAWMEELVTEAFHGFTREVLSVSYCEESNMVAYFATLRGQHPGAGKEMHSDYSYLVQLNGEGKVETVRKVWNDFYALQQAGWLNEKNESDKGHRYD